jgi:predicted CXXCH cytochrome family protein
MGGFLEMRKIRVSLSAIMMLVLVGLFGIVASAAPSPNAGIPIVTSSNSVLTGQDYTLTWAKGGSNNVDNYNIIWDGGTVETLSNATFTYNVTAPILGTHRYEIWASATNGDSQHYRGTVEVVNDNSSAIVLPPAATIGNDGSAKTSHTHGDFQNNTAACANCHSAHNGGTNMLLKYQDTELNLCLSCHDGTMGFYNVKTASSAGIFDFDGSHESSSLHNVNAVVKIGDAPGAFANNKTAVGDNFQCSSCHNPHGSVNDRLLTVAIPTSQTTNIPATLVDLGSGKQIGLNLVEDPAYSTFNAGTGVNGVKIYKSKGATTASEITNFNDFCATCHDSYLASRSSGKVAGSFAPNHGFTHTTNSSSAGRNCASCHYSHGTDITTLKDSSGRTVSDIVAAGLMTQPEAEAYMENVTKANTQAGPTAGADSALKKYTNNAICLACHSKDIVTTQTQAAGADFNGKPAK